MKLTRNIRHVRGLCWKDFQGQKSKVEVIAKSEKFCARRNLSVLSSKGVISMKLAINIHHMNGNL